MKLKLPNNVYSLQDLKELTLEVHKYARWYAQTSRQRQVSEAPAAAQPVVSAAATELINNLGGCEQLNQKSLEQLIAALEAYEQTAPRLSITLAAPAPGDLRKTLVSWCRQNISSQILVDFRFNSTLLGGMVVQYGSHIHDWSFRRQLLAARAKFPEVLRRV